MSTAIDTTQTMQDLIEKMGSSLMPIKEGSLIEVTILSKSRNKILVDVQGLTLGFVPEKEFSVDVNELKNGDKILAYILSRENDDGYVVLSLRKADKERFLVNLTQKFKDQEVISVRANQANRGGLIVGYGSLEGFLPTSQLASSHYPKVGNDREKILVKLNQLVGQNLKVKILNFDEQTNKLIFSEKAAGDAALEEKIQSLQVGQELEGTVSGIVDFGIFVDVGGLEGLVHISEISWDKVEDIRSLYKLGDPVKVKILNIEGNKVYFSIKRLTPDPWLDLVKEYKIGQKVRGKVVKINPFGVLVELKGQVKGLLHISELAEELKKKNAKLEDILILGEEYDLEIREIDLENHKINLGLGKSETSTEKAEKKKTPKSRLRPSSRRKVKPPQEN